MNTDAIDNSGRVDMSDHEVNLKILFQPLMQSDVLTIEERNELLKEMTDEVAELVLRNNYTQSLCLSLTEGQSREKLDLYRSLQKYLSDQESLRPSLEYLPTPKQLAERASHNKGLTRPELAVLLAYSKMGLTSHLLTTKLPEEPHLQRHLRNYFPQAVRDGYGEHLSGHPLRREIVACQLTNLLADRLGISFLHGSVREAGGDPADAVWASLAGLESLGFEPLWEEIFAVGNDISTAVQIGALQEIQRTGQQCVEWILGSDLRQNDFGGFVSRYRKPVQEISQHLADFLPSKERNRLLRRVARVSKEGFPEALAWKIARLEYLTSMIGIVDAAQETKMLPEEVARPYYSLGARLSLGRLRDRIFNLEHQTRWEKITASGLIQDLRVFHKRLTVEFLKAERSERLSVAGFLLRFPRELKRYYNFYAEMRRSQQFSLASITVLNRILLEAQQEISRSLDGKG